MAFRSLTTVLTLYRGGTLTLEQAAEESGLSTARVESELRTRGIPIREADSIEGTDT
jgi:predicted HTH domain antitoxin